MILSEIYPSLADKTSPSMVRSISPLSYKTGGKTDKKNEHIISMKISFIDCSRYIIALGEYLIPCPRHLLI